MDGALAFVRKEILFGKGTPRAKPETPAEPGDVKSVFSLPQGSVHSTENETVDLIYEYPSNSDERYLDDDTSTATARHTEIAKAIFRSSIAESSKEGQKTFQKYQKKSNNWMTSRSADGMTILHRIIQEMTALVKYKKMSFLNSSIPPGAREFLECFLVENHQVLGMQNNVGIGPLYLAALQMKSIVSLVADLIIPMEKLSEITSKCRASSGPDSWGQCSVDIVLPDALSAKFHRPGAEHTNRYRCIHEALDVDGLKKWCLELRETVSTALQLHNERDKLAVSGTILHALIDQEFFAKEAAGMKVASFQRLLEVCGPMTLLDRDGKGYCPLHKAILLYNQSNIDFSHLHDIIQALIERCPDTLYEDFRSTTADKSVTMNPYILLKSTEPRPGTHTNASSQERHHFWSKTEKLVRYACIGGKLDWQRKVKYLYPVRKDAKTIFLDMAFPNIIDADFVEDIGGTVRLNFESALAYASFRRDLDEASGIQLGPPGDASLEDRNPYKGVFQWLRQKKGIQKIFKIVVDDLVPYPHTDTAIIAAVKDFDVETWDWRKLDLSSQTILTAAKGTRELYLQSSGNEAVLRGWGCRHGLPLLSDLKSVTIVMHPNIREPKSDCEANYNSFKGSFLKWKPDMKNHVFLKFADEPTKRADKTREAIDSLDNHITEKWAWVKAMRKFITYVNVQIHRAANEEGSETEESEDKAKVVIALIDNGVDSTNKDIPLVTGGISYHGEGGSTAFRDFYTGPSVHGTQMAACICEVCPMANLFVVRLDESIPGQSFTVDSAIKGVLQAIEMEVDIISMSWTFHEDGASSEQRRAFKKAIQKAHTNGIILFNSLNDIAMTNWENYLPLSLNQVIRIGSATKWGEKAQHSKSGLADYLFPGEDIPSKIKGGSNEGTIGGSSVATAYAAGLAGFIIYTVRAMNMLEPELPQSYKGVASDAMTRKGIERAFRTLGGDMRSSKPRDLFVDPCKLFPQEPNQLEDLRGKVGVLSKFLGNLGLLQ